MTGQPVDRARLWLQVNALVPQGALQGLRRSRVEQAGVRLIEYPNLDQRHTDVVRILEWLASGDP